MKKRFLSATVGGVIATGVVLYGQGGDGSKVVSEMRRALRGEVEAVKTVVATGKSQRARGATSSSGDYELALELPDKYFTKQLMADSPFGAIVVKQGFNGSGLIQNTEAPTQMSGPMQMVVRPSGSSPNANTEQQTAARARQLVSARHDFARMALGMFGDTGSAFPLEFSYVGTAESADGRADVIGIKGPSEFAGELFVDQKTHLPLMFRWMAPQPRQAAMSTTRGGGGGGASLIPAVPSSSKQEPDKMIGDSKVRLGQQDAERTLVEYRMFYSDYRPVDGLQLPHRFQESVGQTPSTEINIEHYKINSTINSKKFETVK